MCLKKSKVLTPYRFRFVKIVIAQALVLLIVHHVELPHWRMPVPHTHFVQALLLALRFYP